MTELLTDRLLLRDWQAADRAPFAALNADPEVMAHFPAVLDRAASDDLADRFDRHLRTHGWGLWVVETRSGGEFLGVVGLNPVPEVLPLAPAVELGWRLARNGWGHGYATEAAHRAVRFAFAEPAENAEPTENGLGLSELVAFTTHDNLRSQRVMQRLGMVRDPASDFDHPRVPPDWPGRRHVVHRLLR